MPFPYFIRKLFQNDGAGEKLNPDIVPTTVNGVAADAQGNITVTDSDIKNGPFLPTAGGTMTGALKLQAEIIGRSDNDYKIDPIGIVMRNTDTKRYVLIAGGTDGSAKAYSGSTLFLTGNSCGEESGNTPIPAGSFCLAAAKSAAQGTHVLAGYPDGTLFWDNGEIFPLVAHQFSVYDQNNHHSWFRRYADGWIEQGGYIQIPTANTTYTLTLHVPFSNSNWTGVLVPNGNTGQKIAMANTGYTRNATSMTLWNEFASAEISWYACGY